MTALTANRATEFLENGRIWRTFGVAADAVVYAGALVAINTTGYLEPASADATLRIVGIACTEQDATGLANGDLDVEVDSNICLLVNGSSSITANDVEALCYAVDDQTVHLLDGSSAAVVGTSQVTRGDVVAGFVAGVSQVSQLTVTPSATDTVGFHIDSLPPLTVTSVDLATDNVALRNLFNGNAQYAAIGTAVVAAGKIDITFSDTATHTFTDDSSGGTADVAHAITTAAVAAVADAVAVTVDSLPTISIVPTSTDDDVNAALLRDEWNASAEHLAEAVASINTAGAESYFILTFVDDDAHTVTDASAGGAAISGIAATTAAVAGTAAVAATRPLAGRIHQVDSSGVFVRPLD